MKAAELRIGNKFICDGKIIDIYNIDTNVVNQEYVHDEKWNAIQLSDLCLIPLTEEWLLKFGFKELRNNRYANYGLNEFDVFKDTNEFVYFTARGRVNLKYVHQLQNLYFALTGKELEIKDLLKKK